MLVDSCLVNVIVSGGGTHRGIENLESCTLGLGDAIADCLNRRIQGRLRSAERIDEVLETVSQPGQVRLLHLHCIENRLRRPAIPALVQILGSLGQ